MPRASTLMCVRTFYFCPSGFETLDPWDPSAISLVSNIGTKLADVTGEARSSAFFAPEFEWSNAAWEYHCGFRYSAGSKRFG